MPSENIRKVILLKLKFHTTNYHQVIDCDPELKTEPPFLTPLSDEKVIGIFEKPLSVPKWPKHTQSVERGIWAVSEVCTEMTGFNVRDDYIRQRLGSRRIMPIHLGSRIISDSIINCKTITIIYAKTSQCLNIISSHTSNSVSVYIYQCFVLDKVYMLVKLTKN